MNCNPNMEWNNNGILIPTKIFTDVGGDVVFERKKKIVHLKYVCRIQFMYMYMHKTNL